ncbi:MAG: tRNA wybutosine-synthesizing protein 2 [Thermoplasmata archaeon]|nr:tRNA wybutosine-synthesizing protein 2 [Thermoplasmata archaeon]
MERHRAEALVRALQREGLLDPARRIVSGERVTVPVLASPRLAAIAREHGAEVVEADAPAREGRVTPREQVLRPLPEALHALVPDKWEQHGDVLVLRLPDALLPHAAEVGAAFADAMGLRTVLHDPAGVAGELREMRAVPIFGDDPVALHVENGVRYRFDAGRIMFSSGNLAERMRAADLNVRGETVADMFAGIGYFTLPIAVHGRPARVVAMEKNPLSFRYLQENVALNGVGGIVEPWLGDNRDHPAEGFADRVLMGYFPRTERFLPKALALLKPSGGTLHMHNTAHAGRWREELVGQVLAAAPRAEILEARVVKTFSPGVVHAIVVARV